MSGSRAMSLRRRERRVKKGTRERGTDGLEEESVVVGAAEVVAAIGADELAVVAGEAMAAGGADLAVVIDLRSLGGGLDASEADRTTL